MKEEILKVVLGGSRFGPSICYENGCWILYVLCGHPEEVEVLCRHEDWNQFLELCEEYS